MRLLPVLLLLIESSLLNGAPGQPFRTLSGFYIALEQECPFIQNVTNFSQQDIFEKCRHLIFDEIKVLSKDTEQTVRCLLYYNNFVSFCKDLIKENVTPIPMKLLFPDLKNYTITKICTNSTIFPVNKTIRYPALEAINLTETNCVTLCNDYDAPVVECSLAHYFANVNVTLLKNTSLPVVTEKNAEQHTQSKQTTNNEQKATGSQNATKGDETAVAQTKTLTIENAHNSTVDNAPAISEVKSPDRILSPLIMQATISKNSTGEGKVTTAANTQASDPGKSVTSEKNETESVAPKKVDAADIPQSKKNDTQAQPAPNVPAVIPNPPSKEETESKPRLPEDTNKKNPPNNEESQALSPPEKIKAEQVDSDNVNEDANSNDTPNESSPNFVGLYGDDDDDEDPDFKIDEDKPEEKKPEEKADSPHEKADEDKADSPQEKADEVKADSPQEKAKPAKVEGKVESKDAPESKKDADPVKDVDKDKADPGNDIPINDSAFDDIDGESYFFSYFMVICVLFVLGYVGYHNRQKVIALVLEGKQGKRRYRGRRPNSANYHKLDSNLEEAISSSYTKSSSHIIY